MRGREDEYDFADEDFTLESIIAEFKDDAYSAPDNSSTESSDQPDLDADAEELIREISDKYLKSENVDAETVKPASFTVRLDMPEGSDSENISHKSEGDSHLSDTPADEYIGGNTQPEAKEYPYDVAKEHDIAKAHDIAMERIGHAPDSVSTEEEPETPKPSAQIRQEPSGTTRSDMEQKVMDFRLPSLNDAAIGNMSKQSDGNKKSNISRTQSVESDDFAPVSIEINDSDPEVTHYNNYASQMATEEMAQEVKETLGEETGSYDFMDEGLHEQKGFFSRFTDMLTVGEYADTDNDAEPPVHKSKHDSWDDDTYYEAGSTDEEGEYDAEDLEPDGMTPVMAALHYGKGNSSTQLKGVVSIIISLIMLWMCISFGSSLPFPIDFTNNPLSLAGILLLLQLFVMLIGLDVITAGISDIIGLRVGLESLVTVSGIICAADAAHMLITGNVDLGLPYSAVISFAIGCALIGLRLTRTALQTTLKAASTASSPYVVSGKPDATDDETVLLKVRRSPEGFLRKCQQADYSEYIYSMIAPLTIVVAIVFAVVASVGKGEGTNFLHCFAALLTAGTSLSGLVAYGLPFSMLSKKLSRAGAALGGWGGACDIHEASAAVILDQDVFPSGTLSISGIRVFRKSDTSRVVSYTGSIIAESESGLSQVFAELIRKQKYTFYPISDFACYEGGGIGAVVGGDEVIIGSSNFMKLMGIRLPKNLNVKNAVFTAIKGELVGVFSISYVPINSVQEALVSIFRTKIKPLFAIRDFNVTPLMLQHKFKISTDKIQFLSFEDRYRISSQELGEFTKPSAILCREGLGPLADVITGGKRLKSAVKNNVIFSVVGSFLGMLIMFYLCFNGSYTAAKPSNMLIFMLLWLIPVIVTSWPVKYN